MVACCRSSTAGQFNSNRQIPMLFDPASARGTPCYLSCSISAHLLKFFSRLRSSIFPSCRAQPTTEDSNCIPGCPRSSTNLCFASAPPPSYCLQACSGLSVPSCDLSPSMHRTLSYTSLPPLFPVKPFSSDYPPHIPPHPQQSAYPSPPMFYSPPPGGNPSHHQHDYRSGHQRSNSMRSDESRHPQSQQYVNGEHYHQYHQKYASTYQTPAPSSGDLRSRAVTHQSEYPFHTSLSSSSATTAAGAGATAAQTPARRTKSHVASACVNCRKAHLACDGRFIIFLILTLFFPSGRHLSSGVARARTKVGSITRFSGIRHSGC